MGLKIVKSRDLREMIEAFDVLIVINDMVLEREMRLNSRLHTMENKLREAQGNDPKSYEQLQPITQKNSYQNRLNKRKNKHSINERLLKVRKVEN